jgi:hypothetical protein
LCSTGEIKSVQSATEGERDDEETIHRQGGADVANFHFENDLFHVAPVTEA